MVANIVTLLVIVTVIALACLKLVIDKKNGVQCSGCPYGKLGNQLKISYSSISSRFRPLPFFS
jgi:hypothetical protein